MTDEAKVTEAIVNDIQGGEKPAEPKEEMVSKAEFDKQQQQLKETQEKLDKEAAEHEKFKNEIFSPGYIDALSKPAEGAAAPTAPNPAAAGVDPNALEGMTRAEYADYLINRVSNELGPQVNKMFSEIKQSVDVVQANAERDALVAKHSDATEYFNDMVKIIQTTPGIKMEQAYKIAKQDKQHQKDVEEQRKAALAQSEKPGGTASDTTQPAAFKTASDANEDAWSRVVGDKDKI